ncbi:hypothetical protein MXL54_07080 [Enterobacteriaceae bacterium G50]|nr:hypothetical protein [Enterobacteriaceae bacterium G50]
MAILGYFLSRFPAFFDLARILAQRKVEIFPDIAGKVGIFVLLFTRLPGIKRGARLIPKKCTN